MSTSLQINQQSQLPHMIWKLALLILPNLSIVQVQGSVPLSHKSITVDTVRSVHIVGRWVPDSLQKKVEELVGKGQPYDPIRINSGFEAIRTVLVDQENKILIPFFKAASGLYIDVQIDSTNKPNIDITIRPYYLRIDLIRIGANSLPIPRTAKSTFYKGVPPLLLILFPVISLNNDSRYGVSLGLQTSTNLFNPTGQATKGENTGKTRLNLLLGGRYSITQQFYDFQSALVFERPMYAEDKLGWYSFINYEKSQNPLLAGQNEQNVWRGSLGIQGRRRGSLVNAYVGGLGFRQLQNYYKNDAYTIRQSETAVEGYILTETHFGKDILTSRLGKYLNRLGLWVDAGFPNATSSYQRLAALTGFAFNVATGRKNPSSTVLVDPLAKHQFVGIELLVGAGHAWGNVPVYNQFLAGNVAQNFLYDAFELGRQRNIPNGPLVRSLGERTGALDPVSQTSLGGTGYWHVNVNVALPIPSWSKPLIPDEVISERRTAEGKLIRTTLRTALMKSANTAQKFIADDLSQSRPDDVAEKEAEKIVNKDVKPTLNFLAEQANIYAIKPVVLLDLAQLGTPSQLGRTWFGTGLGLQMHIVNARFEVGYIHTIAPSDVRSGNAYVRLTIQNFY